VNISDRRAIQSLRLTVAVLLIVHASGCSAPFHSQSRASQQSAMSAPENSDSANPIEVTPIDTDWAAEDSCSEMFSNLFVVADSIKYNGYEVVRLKKTVHDNGYGGDIPVTYAILKSGDKTLSVFNGVLYFGGGNSTGFGLASLLGNETKQLIISETVRRGGRHWIVDVSSDGATLFDSKDWDGGNEEVCVHDFDGDGVEEISMAITSFWGFGVMSMAESPLPCVVFKYESKRRKYLPDRSAFARELTNIEEDVQNIDPNENPRGGLPGLYLATRLDIFLRYVYAGRETDGWSFFDKTYSLKDKQDVKREIKRKLDQEPVYRFVYGLKP
jgi:hypothetical protein